MEAAADVQVTKAAERFAAKEAEDLRREREEAAPTRHPLAVFQKWVCLKIGYIIYSQL